MNKAFNKQGKTKWSVRCNEKIIAVRAMFNKTIKNMYNY